MGCGCGKKSTRHEPPKNDYHSRYAFLTPRQLADKKAREAADQRSQEELLPKDANK